MISDLSKILNENSDRLRAKSMSKYMRGKFEFLGIKRDLRKELSNSWIKTTKELSEKDLIKLIFALWSENHREYQYVGLDVISKNKRRISPKHIQHFEELILQKSWWDTVDWLGAHIIGKIFMEDQLIKKEYTLSWLNSPNIWLNRCCLIYQLFYREKTNIDDLSFNICALMNKNDFFIQKAIGWALRQYSKTNHQFVEDFVNGMPDISQLAKREALKYIKNTV